MSGSVNAPESLLVACEHCGGGAFQLYADGRVFCDACAARMSNCRAVVLLAVAGAQGAPVNAADHSPLPAPCSRDQDG